jgi:NADPH2:quinone reductase
VRVHGTGCFGGNLSNRWTVREFSPNEYLPKGARLAGYTGGWVWVSPETIPTAGQKAARRDLEGMY